MLTDLVIGRLTYAPGKKKKHADGRGLYLLLTPTAKLWRYNYRLDGKAFTISFGNYADVSLATARQKLQQARELVAQGINPTEAKRSSQRARKAAESFATVAQEWLSKQLMAPRTKKKAKIHLKLLLAAFGSRPLNTIEAPQVLAAIRPIEATGKRDTAHRLLQLVSRVCRYGVATGRVTRDVTADLRGALAPIVLTHRAALTAPKEIGALLRAIDSFVGTDAVMWALKLAPLLFVRPGELRHMEWSEIDGNLWRIPAAKTKMRRDHLVPLSTQALAILEDARAQKRSRYVFPGRDGSRPLSDMTLGAALARLGYTPQQMTAHGFRAMASTRLHELGYPSAVIERQLAHVERNKVKAAYHRAEYLSERTAMMQSWGEYLDSLRSLEA
jgi:integrase